MLLLVVTFFANKQFFFVVALRRGGKGSTLVQLPLWDGGVMCRSVGRVQWEEPLRASKRSVWASGASKAAQ